MLSTRSFVAGVMVLALLVLAIEAMPSPRRDAHGLMARDQGVDIEVRSAWDGDVALAPRADPAIKAAFISNAGNALTSFGLGLCAFSALGFGAAPCGIGLVILALNFLFNTIAAFKSGPAAPGDGDDYGFDFDYAFPEVDAAGRGRYEQMKLAHDAAADGVPTYAASVAHAGAGMLGGYKVYYSHSFNTTRRGGRVRRVHVLPPTFDVARLAPTATGTALAARGTHATSTTYTGTDKKELYGGYVYEDLQDDEEAARIGENSHPTFNADIADQMDAAYKASGKFNRGGVYCMDIDSTTNSAAIDYGYAYYFGSSTAYDSGNENTYLATCQEDS